MDKIPIEIIHLEPDEWPAYRRLRLEGLLESPQAYGSTYAEQKVKPDHFWRSRLVEAAGGEDGWLLFARREGKLLGMIGAFRNGVIGEKDADHLAHIVSVYVTPSARGQGIAHLLMQAILDILRAKGIRRVQLSVNRVQTAALNLYQRLGFEIYQTETNLMGDGQFYDELLMEKVLDSE